LEGNKKIYITKENLGKLEDIFEVKFSETPNSMHFNLINKKLKSEVSLEIIIEQNSECLISVYTANTHLQLQGCTFFIISNLLEEVIFISEDEYKISGLIVSKYGDCSLYSNVDKKVFKADFSQLNSEKLISAISLSVAEE